MSEAIRERGEGGEEEVCEVLGEGEEVRVEGEMGFHLQEGVRGSEVKEGERRKSGEGGEGRREGRKEMEPTSLCSWSTEELYVEETFSVTFSDT